MFSSRRTRVALVAGAAGFCCLAALALAQSASDATRPCFHVAGNYIEHAVTGPDCSSPVGLCIAGTYRGAIRGDFEARTSSIVATADTPTTSVQLFTSDSTIDARLGNRAGTLIMKVAGVFSAADDGPTVNLQTIVGGSGDLAGAHGALRSEGTFSFANGGHSRYVGSVCLP